MMKVLISLLCLCISGCQTISNPDTFAVCKAGDVVSTAVAIHGGAHEANPWAARLLQHGYAPLIAYSVLSYYVLKKLNNPTWTGVNTVVTCAAVANNVSVILK